MNFACTAVLLLSVHLHCVHAGHHHHHHHGNVTNPEENQKLFEGDIIPTYSEIREDYGKTFANELVKDGVIDERQKKKYGRDVALGSAYAGARWTDRMGSDVVHIPYTFGDINYIRWEEDDKDHIRKWLKDFEEKVKQAGADLCQAQGKLRLVRLQLDLCLL